MTHDYIRSYEIAKGLVARIPDEIFASVIDVTLDIYSAALTGTDQLDSVKILFDPPVARFRILLPDDSQRSHDQYVHFREQALHYLNKIGAIGKYQLNVGIKNKQVRVEIHYLGGLRNLVTALKRRQRSIGLKQLLTEKNKPTKKNGFDGEGGVFYWNGKSIKFRKTSLRCWIIFTTFENLGQFVSYSTIEEKFGKEVHNNNTFEMAVSQLNEKFRKVFKIRKLLTLDTERIKMILTS